MPGGDTVLVEFENGIAWVTMNRPEKRNAVSPTLATEMLAVMNALETDPRCKALVLTGAGDAFCAGMDLKEFFRETDAMSPPEREQIIRTNAQWQWRQLMHYPKPTIAMVNGWCFGGAFTPLVSCDLAIAAEEATFGLSEINWGIIPAGVVTKAVAQVMSQRDALYYIMTGETFDGRKAAAMKLVNEAVPLRDLRRRTKALARPDGQEPDGAARRQDRLSARARHVVRRRQRLPDVEERPGAPARSRAGPRAGPQAVPRREIVPAGPAALSARPLNGAMTTPGPTEPAPLDRLMRPRSVAIVGASAEPGSIGGAVLHNLERCGYGGAIHLVSRRAKEINARTCVAASDERPDGIDAAVLVVPQQGVVEGVGALRARRRCRGVRVGLRRGRRGGSRRAGPADAGGSCVRCACAGAELHRLHQLRRRRGADLRDHRAGADRRAPRRGVVTQSGALAGALRIALLAKGLGVSHAVSTGNEADLATEDFLAFLLDDADTRAVVLFVEQVRRPQLFLALAERARSLAKPIVLLHPGKSTRARASASSHTGALAGDHAAMTALLRYKAVVLVDTIDELIDAADLLARAKPPVGGAGIITNSGAIKGFALDFAETIGLDVPAPAPPTLAALKEALPPFASLDNPVDVTAQVIKDISIWTRAAAALLADPGIGSLAMLAMPGGPKQAMDKVHALLPAILASGKPAVVAALGDESPVPAEFFTSFRAKGIPVFRSPERAMRALALATAYGRALQMAGDAAPMASESPPLPQRGVLPEYAGKGYLAALGIPVPPGKLATDLAAAKAVAATIGYPVALKAQASALTHKSDTGGVILRVGSERALASAWMQMQDSMARAGVTPDGILIEAMGRGGLEMIVGARRDPDWGPVLMVGLGGVFVETLGDVRLMPADLPVARVLEEIGRLARPCCAAPAAHRRPMSRRWRTPSCASAPRCACGPRSPRSTSIRWSCWRQAPALSRSMR